MPAYSAPGKALLAGGYLVLDPAYRAYVVALLARMHAVASTTPGSGIVTVASPQFAASTWTYTATEQVAGLPNPFARAVVEVVGAYTLPTADVSITVYSDREYHTANGTTPKAVGVHTFLHHQSPIGEVAKTGLGLSAGLVTVLTAALLDAWTGSVDTEVCHKLAQIAHCRAQGKVGLGFDVAAAVYGSCVYRRFAPAAVAPALEDVARVRETVEALWDYEATPCTLPRGVHVVLGDVDGGSNTPLLVSKVLKWRQAGGSAGQVYSDLDAANNALVQAFGELAQQDAANPAGYEAMLAAARSVRPSTLTALAELNPDYAFRMSPVLKVVAAIAAIRSALRAMTRGSRAEIEPPVQTTLLNQCMLAEGVLGGVVPGAGGYDAVCVVCVGDKPLRQLGLPVLWLHLLEESHGLRAETPESYQ